MLIDLTADEDEHAVAEAAKQRIMKHAQQVLARQTQVAAPAPAQQPEVVLLDDELEEEAQGTPDKRVKRDHSGPGPMSGTTPAATGNDKAGSPHPGSWTQAVTNPMNDMLKALHQERLRRQQQQAPPQHAQQDPVANAHASNGLHATQAKGSSSPQQPSSNVAGKRRAPSSSHARNSEPAAMQPTAGAPPPAAKAHSGPQPKAAAAPGHMNSQPANGPAHVSILTYNLWFEEGVALAERMAGLAQIIHTHRPDVLMFQEVTQNMMVLWAARHSWLCEQYRWTQPSTVCPYFTLLGVRKEGLTLAVQEQRHEFKGSQMARDVLSLGVTLPGRTSLPPLLLATSHLESPIPGQMGSDARRQQVQEGSQVLASRSAQLQAAAVAAHQRRLQPQGEPPASVDIVWGGDFNWIAQQADAPQLPQGWQDVWPALHPGQPGHTWDARTNAMLRGSTLPASRLDRFFVRLSRWQLRSLELVGTAPLPGVRAKHRKKEVDVLVSDHYGLLLKLACPDEANGR